MQTIPSATKARQKPPTCPFNMNNNVKKQRRKRQYQHLLACIPSLTGFFETRGCLCGAVSLRSWYLRIRAGVGKRFFGLRKEFPESREQDTVIYGQFQILRRGPSELPGESRPKKEAAGDAGGWDRSQWWAIQAPSALTRAARRDIFRAAVFL